LLQVVPPGHGLEPPQPRVQKQIALPYVLSEQPMFPPETVQGLLPSL
jgi:hypothetical protein